MGILTVLTAGDALAVGSATKGLWTIARTEGASAAASALLNSTKAAISGFGDAVKGVFGKGTADDVTAISISKSKYPESAAHIEDAQSLGHPSVLTIDRSGAAARRKESLKDIDTIIGKDRDEYPPAMFKEGGIGASVRPISPADNRGAGACIGAQCRNLVNGTKVKIGVTD